MTSVVFATFEDEPGLDPDSRPVLDALRRRGIEAEAAVWSDRDVDWAHYDAVVLRSVWDYFLRPDEFATWIDRVAVLRPLWNPADVVHWNAHKSYLADLGARGLPVVDSVALGRGEHVDLAALMAEHGWDDAIFKPAVAGGALGLERIRGADEARAAQQRFDALLAEGEVLVQPFLPAIVAEGELSLVYFNNELSHTLRKRAKPGDIRVQPIWGGTAVLEEPPPEALAIGARVLDAVPGDLMYARVDLVRAADGSLRLIELEVIEPLLFLELDPAAVERYADAVAERVV